MTDNNGRAMREMTLREIVDRLPSPHLAQQQLAELVAVLDDLCAAAVLIQNAWDQDDAYRIYSDAMGNARRVLARARKETQT